MKYTITQSFSTENNTVQDESLTQSFTNKKEAKNIITRYDLKNSLLFVQDFSKDWDYNLEQINNLLKKRGEFLEDLVQYL
jgi:hypothetical protein